VLQFLPGGEENVLYGLCLYLTAGLSVGGVGVASKHVRNAETVNEVSGMCTLM
jgi:hypothetical protein